jgi:LCP family protein required for cell wall assembly
MIEDELRTSFARHEDLVPDADGLLPAIDDGARLLRRRRRVHASAVAALTVLVMAAVPVLATRVMHRPHQLDGVAGAIGAGRVNLTGPLNFLILGLDRRPGQPADQPARADTIMIVHVSASHDRGYLVSVPRDLRVDIPGHGPDKINAAYAYGGRDLTERAVEKLTGLTFNGTAEMRFEGLSRLTDALGGVPMCLDRRVASAHTNRVFEPGCHRLAGEEALDLLRQRYDLPGGALDRDRHARRFISALLDEATRTNFVSSPRKLSRVLTATGDAMTVDLQKDTDVIDLAWQLRGLMGTQLSGAEVPVSDALASGEAYLTAAPDAAGLFEALRADDLDRWLAADRTGETGN